MMALASACVAMQSSYIAPDGVWFCARGHAPSMQCAIPGGEPLYPCPMSRLLSDMITAKYCRFEHVEKMGASW